MRSALISGAIAIAAAAIVNVSAGTATAVAGTGLPLEPAAPAAVSVPETAHEEVAGVSTGSAGLLTELATLSACVPGTTNC